MNTEKPIQPPVAPNQIWRDNYDYGTGYVRRIRVLSLDGDVATIQAIAEDGSAKPARKAKLTRFNGTKSGYSFESAS